MENNQIVFEALYKDSKVPFRATSSAAGWDLSAYTDETIPVGDVKKVGTGIKLHFPPGTYGRLAGRSGLAQKGIWVHNGIVDPDYTGEIFIIMVNLSKENYLVRCGDRIAQVVCEEYRQTEAFGVYGEHGITLSGSREERAFGSSG